jgi:hypothetical protein
LRHAIIARLAAGVLATAGALALAAALYFFKIYGWEHPPSPVGYTLLGAAAVLLAAMRLRGRWRLAAASAVMTTVVVAYAAEIIMAFGPARPLLPMWSFDGFAEPIKRDLVKDLSSAPIDFRTREQFLTAVRRHHPDAVSAVKLAPAFDSHPVADGGMIPLGGVANAYTVLCNQTGNFVTYESDEHGFRNPRGIWNSGSADVAVVGQSLAQGYCVRDGAGFVDLLRRRYPRLLNLGFSGGTPLFQLAAIREYLPAERPRLVLWAFSEWIDLHDYRSHPRPAALARYLDDSYSQHLAERQPAVDDLVRRAVDEYERPQPPGVMSAGERAGAVLKLWSVRQALNPETDEDRVESLFAALAEALPVAQREVKAWGGELCVVYLPSWVRYEHRHDQMQSERERVLRMVRALNIPLFDAEPAFDEQADPLSLFPFRTFGHYNEHGHALVAEALLDALRSRERQSPILQTSAARK